MPWRSTLFSGSQQQVTRWLDAADAREQVRDWTPGHSFLREPRPAAELVQLSRDGAPAGLVKVQMLTQQASLGAPVGLYRQVEGPQGGSTGHGLGGGALHTGHPPRRMSPMRKCTRL